MAELIENDYNLQFLLCSKLVEKYCHLVNKEIIDVKYNFLSTSNKAHDDFMFLAKNHENNNKNLTLKQLQNFFFHSRTTFFIPSCILFSTILNCNKNENCTYITKLHRAVFTLEEC